MKPTSRYTFRDRVIDLNWMISHNFIDKMFDGLVAGIEWTAPFMPWIVTATVILGFTLGWFRVFG